MSQSEPQPESLFDLLALSFGNAALVGLGMVPDPESGKIARDLSVAEHNVELLAMLETKTKGNLTQNEAKLISSLLYDLRLKFVAAKKEIG